MAIALVGSEGTVVTSGSGSVNPGFGQSTTSGNLLIAWISCNNSGATNPFSTSSPGWTIINPANGAAFEWCAIAYKNNCGAGETAPTFSNTSSSTGYGQCAEFSGAVTTSPLDQSGSSNSSTATQTVTNTAVDSLASELIIFCSWYNGGNNSASITNTMKDSNGTSLTVNSTNNATAGIATVYNFCWAIAGATLGTSADTATSVLNVFDGGSAALASFKPAAASLFEIPSQQLPPLYQVAIPLR